MGGVSVDLFQGLEERLGAAPEGEGAKAAGGSGRRRGGLHGEEE